MKKHLIILSLLAVASVANGFMQSLQAQTLSEELVDKATSVLKTTVPPKMGIGSAKVVSVEADESNKALTFDCNSVYADVPFTAATVETLKKQLKEVAGGKYADYKVNVTIKGVAIEKYLPEIDKKFARKPGNFVEIQDANRHYGKGLDGNIIALWQSHGWYFEPKLDRWEWQRARVWQTVEDLYTQSYVMPFLMPMLENAGAYVMSPRERDVHNFEIVVDNDGAKSQSSYSETVNGEKWKAGKEAGFAWKRDQYVAFENPFVEGSYREVKATKKAGKVSSAHWSATMPEDGEYAVYVSYKSLPKSVSDATYTINSLSGSRTIKVNQRMGGGTWIYLGHYPLKKGENKDVVVLTNLSKQKGVVTADAVKIGGGMGNVARRVEKPAEGQKVNYSYNPEIDYHYKLSKYPRFTEGSRYWLQWAGAPDSVYTKSKLYNDYNDDYQSRAEWVNWLAGGSEVLPEREGLNIPVDLSFAFHSDAGTTLNDSIIGTLGIYMTKEFGDYANGTPRIYSRLLTNAISTHIVNDIRAEFEPNWTRRGMWDKSYYEARVPEVPCMLLELLSHQNFADMKYGLDPSFRFTVSRAIYKGMLEFLANRDGRDYVVQPLPVNSFAIVSTGGDAFKLMWKPTADKQVAGGAMPTKYIVEERIGGGAFKEIAVVETPEYAVTIGDNEVHSYRIVALNAGGRSFASETLALGLAPESKGMVMVVNGFTRVSAPDWFESNRREGQLAGFIDSKDSGVPYISDISYVGPQFEYRRSEPWYDDDSSGFGASDTNYETKVTAGNTFDYASVHGESILAAGYSFVSASVKSVEDGLSMSAYPVVDFIFGKQKEVQLGSGAMPNRYKIFTPALIDAIKKYTSAGGNVLMSGSYVGADIWDKTNANEDEKTFAKEVLGYRWRMSQAEASGKVYMLETANKCFKRGWTSEFCSKPNEKIYSVESPDGILPSGKNGITIVQYADNNMAAGVACEMQGYRTVVIGFPIEALKCGESQKTLMKSALNYLINK